MWMIELSATLLAVVGAYLVSIQKRQGFVLYLLANILWIIFDIYYTHYWQGALFCYFILTAIYGWVYWGKNSMGDWTWWRPTAENINNLPQPVRSYIHDLETACSSADIIQENAALRQNCEALQLLLKERREGAQTKIH